MSKQRRVAIATCILGLLAVIGVLNASSPVPVARWPSEAYYNLAFSMGWLTRAPSWLAYSLAAVVLIGLTALFYGLGYWLYQKIAVK